MAILITTSDPQGLLDLIKKAIDDKQVVTWSYDRDNDFTHETEQWSRKAWLKPHVGSGELKFIILGQRDVILTKVVKGIYHGRFIEMLVTHFDSKFSTVSADI
jgi:hypothetical protein